MRKSEKLTIFVVGIGVFFAGIGVASSVFMFYKPRIESEHEQETRVVCHEDDLGVRNVSASKPVQLRNAALYVSKKDEPICLSVSLSEATIEPDRNYIVPDQERGPWPDGMHMGNFDYYVLSAEWVAEDLDRKRSVACWWEAFNAPIGAPGSEICLSFPPRLVKTRYWEESNP